MKHTKISILIAIHRTTIKGGKHYIGPSIDAIIDLVARRHGNTIGRRWLFQCMHDLQAEGLLKRQPRYKKNEENLWRQIPSLITITLKGAKKLYNLGADGAAKLIKEIMGWIHKGDQRWPNYKEPATTENESRSGGAPVKLGYVLNDLAFQPT